MSGEPIERVGDLRGGRPGVGGGDLDARFDGAADDALVTEQQEPVSGLVFQ